MRRCVPTLTIALAACWACIGPVAIGQAQTGNPQIDQYTEHLPDSSGGQPTGGDAGGGGEGPSGGGEPVLDPEQRSGLEALGEDGAGVAELTEDTAPNAGGSGSAGTDSSNDSAAGAPAEQSGGESDGDGADAPATTSSNFDRDEGLGLLLPLIIGGLALSGLGVALWRRRAAGTPA